MPFHGTRTIPLRPGRRKHAGGTAALFGRSRGGALARAAAAALGASVTAPVVPALDADLPLSA
jgi:hypothetical protein